MHSIHKKVVRDAAGRRLVIQGLLGRGTFGKVFRAEDEEGGGTFAVKMPLGEEDLGPEAAPGDLQGLLTRLLKESVTAMRRLPVDLQPGALSLVESALPTALAVSEYYEDTFLERLHQGISFADLCTTLAQVCEALEPVHASGQIHGNLSPGNILFAPPDPANPETGPRLRLADPLSGAALQALPTIESIRPGQAGWLPPELRTAASLARLNESADTWAIARLLYAAVVEPEVLKNSTAGRSTPFAGPFDKQAIARFKDALADRLSRDNSNPHVRDLLIRKASMLLTRALHPEAQPSPPKRFYAISELGTRLLELKALFHPGFEQLGMILLDTGRASSAYEEGEEIRFSLAFRCQGGLDDSDLIVCMTYVRDLETNQKVKDSGLVVLPAFDAGRFRFTFRIPTLSPGKYLIRVALAVKGSPGKPIPRDIQIEVKPRPAARRERPTGETRVAAEARSAAKAAEAAAVAPALELALPPKLAEVLAKEQEAELASAASPDNVEKLLADLTHPDALRDEPPPSSRGRTTGPRARALETAPDLRPPRDNRSSTTTDGAERRRGERPVLKAEDRPLGLDRVAIDEAAPQPKPASDGARAETTSPRLRPGALKLPENRTSSTGEGPAITRDPRPTESGASAASPERAKDLLISRSRRERDGRPEGQATDGSARTEHRSGSRAPELRSADAEHALDHAPTQKVSPARDRSDRPARPELSSQDDPPARIRVSASGTAGDARPRPSRSGTPEGMRNDRGVLKSLRPSPMPRTGEADEWSADDITPKENRPGRSTSSREDRHRHRDDHRPRVAGETTRKHLDRHPERSERPARPPETPEERAERKRLERRQEELRKLEERRTEDRRTDDRRTEERREPGSDARRRPENTDPRTDASRAPAEEERPSGLRDVLRRGKEALFDRDKSGERAAEASREGRRAESTQEEAPPVRRSALARLLGSGREEPTPEPGVAPDSGTRGAERAGAPAIQRTSERTPAVRTPSERTPERTPERTVAERNPERNPERSPAEKPLQSRTGERPPIERTVAERLGIDRSTGERTPAERPVQERPQAERPAPMRAPGKPGERFIPEVYYPEARKTALPGDELEEYEQGGLKPHHELILIGVLLTTFIAIVGTIAYVLL